VDLSVRLYASLRERAGTSELALRGLPEALDLAGLKRELARRHPELGALEAVRGAIGASYAQEDRALHSGEIVHLLPPVSGGAPSDAEASAQDEHAALELGRFELCATPLELARAEARVAHPACGAVATFSGTARADNRGRRVLRLEYEAYADMAEQEMARVFADCRAELGLGARPGAAPELRMLVLHRTGVVEIGVAAVAIAVASPHRAPAFAACRYLIDELKRRVPIWKKEVYENGEQWIGERS